MITKKQREVLDFVKSYSKRNGYAPLLNEIRKHFKLSSVSTAHFHISKLKKEGYLERLKNRARGINAPEKELLVKIPLLGTIAAGEPIEAIRENEFIAVPKTKLPSTGNFYALRVIGNSMNDENIKDGDIVLVKQREVAEGKQRASIIDAEDYKIKVSHLKNKMERIEIFLPTLYIKEKCPICKQKQDIYGRCSCVNKDAW